MDAGGRRGCGLVLVYGGLWGLGIVVVNVFATLLTLLVLVAQGGVEAVTSFPANPGIPPGVLATTLLVQFAIMAGLVPLTEAVVRWTWRGGSEVDASWRQRVAWGRPRVWAWVPMGVIGLTAGWLPGWLADQLRQLAPWLDLGAVESLQAALVEGPLLARVTLWIGVGVAAPVVEELVFRGFMWEALRRALPPWATWLGTSVLFAAYHIDPAQALPLLFTALALGWVRWTTGSLWPCIGVHALNNGLGVFAAHLGVQEAAPLGIVVAHALLTLTACGQLYVARSKAGATLGDDAVPVRAAS